MKIGVIGTGAVGILFSVKLKNAGQNVEYAYIDDDVYRGNDTYTVKDGDNVISTQINTVNKISQFSSKKDIIFVLTRAKISAKCVNIASSYLSTGGKIIVLNNWYNMYDVVNKKNIDKLIGLYFDFNVVKENNTAVISRHGNIYIGLYNNFKYNFTNSKNDKINLHLVAQILSNISDVHIDDNFMGFVTGRLILNVTLNTILAITGTSVGKLLKMKWGKRVFTQLICESYNVCQKIGINPRAYVGKLNYRLFVENSYRGRIYKSRIIRILRENNKYFTSNISWLICMGKDTEVDFGVKKIVIFGRKYGVNVDMSQAVINLLDDIIRHQKHISTRILFDKSIRMAYRNM